MTAQRYRDALAGGQLLPEDEEALTAQLEALWETIPDEERAELNVWITANLGRLNAPASKKDSGDRR